jgi:N-acetylglucosamine malate deacetylase 2
VSPPPPPLTGLSSVLVVVAHPDDESFGLGALVSALTGAGIRTSVLCFTAGEASTLTGGIDLGVVRARELAGAAEVLGLSSARLLRHPDGGLADVALARLAQEVATEAETVGADALLVFDLGGVTGHPDHHRATEAALAAARPRGLPVLAWVVPDDVAEQLNREFGTAFCGRRPQEIDASIDVDRGPQRRAIARHASQSGANPVLWRRLELLGAREHVRWLQPRATPAEVRTSQG